MKARYFILSQFSEREVTKREYYSPSNVLVAKEIRRYFSKTEYKTR